jgi:hypothetical protein
MRSSWAIKEESLGSCPDKSPGDGQQYCPGKIWGITQAPGHWKLLHSEKVKVDFSCQNFSPIHPYLPPAPWLKLAHYQELGSKYYEHLSRNTTIKRQQIQKE